MIKYIKGNSKAIIVLHEIYGINKYIKSMCDYYSELGFDVYCPCLIHRKYFSYCKSDEAYSHFMITAGLDVWEDIDTLVCRLKNQYDKVFIHGSSVGATIAWRCSQTGTADGIICCYGSRIRDYTDIDPASITLLIFAHEDSFDVDNTVSQLKDRRNISLHVFNAHHGFMDKYGEYYDEDCFKQATELIKSLLAYVML